MAEIDIKNAASLEFLLKPKVSIPYNLINGKAPEVPLEIKNVLYDGFNINYTELAPYVKKEGWNRSKYILKDSNGKDYILFKVPNDRLDRAELIENAYAKIKENDNPIKIPNYHKTRTNELNYKTPEGAWFLREYDEFPTWKEALDKFSEKIQSLNFSIKNPNGWIFDQFCDEYMNQFYKEPMFRLQNNEFDKYSKYLKGVGKDIAELFIKTRGKDLSQNSLNSLVQHAKKVGYNSEIINISMSQLYLEGEESLCAVDLNYENSTIDHCYFDLDSFRACKSKADPLVSSCFIPKTNENVKKLGLKLIENLNDSIIVGYIERIKQEIKNQYIKKLDKNVEDVDGFIKVLNLMQNDELDLNDAENFENKDLINYVNSLDDASENKKDLWLIINRNSIVDTSKKNLMQLTEKIRPLMVENKYMFNLYSEDKLHSSIFSTENNFNPGNWLKVYGEKDIKLKNYINDENLQIVQTSNNVYLVDILTGNVLDVNNTKASLEKGDTDAKRLKSLYKILGEEKLLEGKTALSSDKIFSEQELRQQGLEKLKKRIEILYTLSSPKDSDSINNPIDFLSQFNKLPKFEKMKYRYYGNKLDDYNLKEDNEGLKNLLEDFLPLAEDYAETIACSNKKEDSEKKIYSWLIKHIENEAQNFETLNDINRFESFVYKGKPGLTGKASHSMLIKIDKLKEEGLWGLIPTFDFKFEERLKNSVKKYDLLHEGFYAINQ